MLTLSELKENWKGWLTRPPLVPETKQPTDQWIRYNDGSLEHTKFQPKESYHEEHQLD